MNNNGENVAESLGDLVNNTLFDSENFVDRVMTQHRHLQHKIFLMMLDTMKRWEAMGEIGMFDARNEYPVAASKVILDSMRKEYGGV